MAGEVITLQQLFKVERHANGVEFKNVVDLFAYEPWVFMDSTRMDVAVDEIVFMKLGYGLGEDVDHLADLCLFEPDFAEVLPEEVVVFVSSVLELALVLEVQRVEQTWGLRLHENDLVLNIPPPLDLHQTQVLHLSHLGDCLEGLSPFFDEEGRDINGGHEH